MHQITDERFAFKVPQIISNSQVTTAYAQEATCIMPTLISGYPKQQNLDADTKNRSNHAYKQENVEAPTCLATTIASNCKMVESLKKSKQDSHL